MHSRFMKISDRVLQFMKCKRDEQTKSEDDQSPCNGRSIWNREKAVISEDFFMIKAPTNAVY